MENKLQQLTQKLYNEGLSKGQQEAEQLVSNAKAQADAIIKDAQAQAESIIKNAQKCIEELHHNAQTEITLASRQAVGTLKEQIAKLIVLNTTTPAVSAANNDAEFIKSILTSLASSWNGTSGSELIATLSEDQKDTLGKIIKDSAAAQLNSGIEIRFDNKIKSGFRVEPKDGGYYLNFSDDDFNALLGQYLRPQVTKILFQE